MSASSPFKMEAEEVTEGVALSPSRQSFSMRIFVLLVVVAEVLVTASLVLVGVWMGHFRGGFAWTENPSKEFNYHPLFMIIGLVLFYGNAMLSYRTVLRKVRKLYAKVIHASLLGCTAVFWGVGLRAAFDSHNLASPPIPNLYTIHSWLGLATVSLFGIQWLLGFASFLLPVFPDRWRALVKPIHVGFGIVIFMLGVATVFAGTTEKLIWTLGSAYSKFASEGVLANCLGMAVAATAVCIIYIVNNPAYARRPLAND